MLQRAALSRFTASRFQDDSSNEEGTIWESLNDGLPDTHPLTATAARPALAIKAAHTHTKTHNGRHLLAPAPSFLHITVSQNRKLHSPPTEKIALELLGYKDVL